MEPVYADVREAVLLSFASAAQGAAPNAAPFPPSTWDAFGVTEAPPTKQQLLAAQTTLAEALFAPTSGPASTSPL